MSKLYRGRDIKGNWHYGELISQTVNGTVYYHIVERKISDCPMTISVVDSSIGALCDMKDKDGNQLYEGDLVVAKLGDNKLVNGTLIVNNNNWLISDGFNEVLLSNVVAVKLVQNN